MRATLIHNTNAGYGKHPARELMELLRAHGYKPKYQSTGDDDWEAALNEPTDVVVVAGGDGTVDNVVRTFMGRGAPLAILPLGTANNIAGSLGICGPPEKIIAEWKRARRQKFDLGVVRGPWKKPRRFAEAMGMGVFAQMMPILTAVSDHQGHETSDAHLRHDLKTLKMLVDACRAAPWELELDGKKISGKFLLIEIMNVAMLGPGLRLAPKADPGDGRFDVVLVEKKHRKALQRYMVQCLEATRPPAKFPTRRAERVTFRWHGSTIHLDSDLWATDKERFQNVKKPKWKPPLTVEASVEPHALEILVPRV